MDCDILIRGVNVSDHLLENLDAANIKVSCPLVTTKDGYAVIAETEWKDRVAIVKNPHGRLIDADDFLQNGLHFTNIKSGYSDFYVSYRELVQRIKDAPTIIERVEAEE